MIHGRANLIIDAAWGSSGKGKLAAFLAKTYGASDASASNMPNAGHTVVEGNSKFVFKMLPSAVVSASVKRVWIGPGAVVDLERLRGELAQTGYLGEIYVHDRAALLRPDDALQENATESIRAIASTGQGCSTAMIRKIRREPEAIVQSIKNADLAATHQFWMEGPSAWEQDVKLLMPRAMWLHEVAQGWALSLNWGTHYPQCTSRDCTTATALNELGIPPSLLGDVYLNIRTFPIRVGNTPAGYSGDFCGDQQETSWEEVAKQSGLPLADIKATEITTVTKRQRRVATYSPSLTKRAAWQNGATKIFVNFIQYLDGSMLGLRSESRLSLSHKVRRFVDDIEEDCGVPVVGVGTGPDTDDVVWWG